MRERIDFQCGSLEGFFSVMIARLVGFVIKPTGVGSDHAM